MVIVLGTVEIHPDDVEAAVAVATALVEATRQEPGCIQYAFGRDIAVPTRFWLSECWRDGEALAAHFTTPHMAAFRVALQGLRVSGLSAQRYEVTGVSDALGG